MYKKKTDRIYRDPVTGRMMEHKGYITRLHWSTDMIGYMRRNYSTMTNEELAGCLGVSQRTITRKAAELGLKKDRKWLLEVWSQNRHLANQATREGRNPGCFRPGSHHNPNGEYKAGRSLSEDTKRKMSAAMRKYYCRNPRIAHERSVKAWITRRKNMSSSTAATSSQI